MEISFNDIPSILLMTAGIFIIYFAMYYRFIYSIVDPLFLFVFTTSFASTLAIFVIPNVADLIHFFGCQFSVWTGFFIAHYRLKFLYNNSHSYETSCFQDNYLLNIVTYFLLFLYLISNFIIGYSKGFALFSETPSAAKFADFQEGFGLFRKMNWALSTFITVSLCYLYFIYKKKKYILLLILVTFLSSLEGSKGAFLQIAIAAGVVFYHPIFKNQRFLLKNFQKYMPILLTGAIGLVFLVLLKENDGIENALLAFIRRLLYTSDSLIYFYTPINLDFFKNYSFLEYIQRLINPITGFLRIQPYQDAIGNILYDNLRAPGVAPESITVGPNAPFYIEGRIYFYYWMAFPYSFLVGYLYGCVRTYYFSITRGSAFFFVFMGSFCHFSQSIIVDSNLTVTQLFNLFFFILPPFLFISFVMTNRIRIYSKKLFNFTKFS